jgi:endonuclease/exonuclease/phosphatase family metal-dependent hydrolase
VVRTGEGFDREACGVRFVTYNIRHAQGLDGLISTRRIAWTLAALEPDVIGMNEVLHLAGRRDQAAAVAERLGMAHSFAEAQSWWVAGGGNAVLTRGRIVEVAEIGLIKGIENRLCLVCTIELDGERFRFASTHLSLGREARRRSIEDLVVKLPDDLPLVLSGDFNADPTELDPIRARLSVADAPPTFPSWRPKTRLDVVAYSAQWREIGVWAARSLASDHLPLIADLELATDAAGRA